MPLWRSFFQMIPPPKKRPSFKVSTFNILDYSPTPRYCAHYADNICNPHTTESRLIKNTNQKREKSISDLLAMARPERVAFGLSLASSSSELMNATMTSLKSSSLPESMALMSYSSLSLLSALALLSFCVNMLAFLSICWSVLRGFFCCKYECLTIAFTFSLLLLFKCCFSV